jgi:hypothetical protein
MRPCYSGRSLLQGLVVFTLLKVTVFAVEVRHDSAGNVTLVSAALPEAPRINPSPPLLVVGLGSPVELVASARGGRAQSFQWLHNGQPISNAQGDSLFLPGTTLADAGTYSVVLSNSLGVVTGVVAQVSFEPRYASFESSSGLVLKSNTLVTNRLLRLTPAALNQNGSAWFPEKLFCRNGFTNRFQFRITTADGLIPADGFSFVVQGSGTNLLADENGPGVVIKFDTFQNSGEPGTNYVAVQHYSSPGIPYTTVDLTPFGLRLNDGATHSVEMTHDGLSVNLWMDGRLILTNAPMPLDAILDAEGRAWVGFGSRSGAGGEDHDILSWSFRPNPESAPPQVVINPASQAVPKGGSARLAALTKAEGSLKYQWLMDGTAIPAGTNRVLVLTDVQSSQAGAYSVVVSNVFGEVGRGTNALAVLLPITNLFSTGVNALGNLLPVGASDPHWQILSGSPTPGAPKTVAEGSLFTTLAANMPSAWLLPTVQTSPSGVSGYRYQTWFSLEPGQEKSAVIRGRWAASGAGADVLINGLPTGQVASNSSAFYPLFISSGFVSGSNSLVFVVTNQVSNLTGLRVELTGSTLQAGSSFGGDSDQDGLADAYEFSNFGNLWQTATNDLDGDGVSNGAEKADGSSPSNALSFRPRLTVSSYGGQVVAEPRLPSYELGATIQLSVFPNVGAIFAGWSGDLVGRTNTVNFTITSNMTVKAEFFLPFNETGWPVPGLIEAENFDLGDEGVAYHDTETTNYGGLYRDTGVDVTGNGFGGYRVGWTSPGEWLNYTINVAASGPYRVIFRVSSGGSQQGSAHLEFGSGNQTLPMTILPTAGWDTYRSVTSSVVRLESGLQVVRLFVDQSPSGFDVDSFQITPATNAPPILSLTKPLSGTKPIVGFDVPLGVDASDPDGTVTNVQCFVNGSLVAQAASSPLAGSWRPTSLGSFTVVARATDNLGLSSTSAPVTVVVQSFGVGLLRREIYTNIPGITLADLTNHAKFPSSPDWVDAVTQFELPQNWGDSYGARLSGYLVPPTNGAYVFYLASDDQGALFLSTDENPSNKVQIAYEPQWGGYREYTNSVNQATRGTPPVNVSGLIPLKAGKTYYVEALMKEGGYGDHLSVAWKTPGGAIPGNGADPIAGQFLAYLDRDAIEVGPATGTLLHRYKFDEAPGSTVVHDLVGTAHGTVVNSKGTNFNGAGQFRMAGGAAGDSSATYIDLPDGLVSELPSVTIEGWASWNGPAGSVWQRVFDFGSSSNGTGIGYMFLTPSSGIAGQAARFAVRPGINSEAPVLDALVPFEVGVPTHFAVVYDSPNGIARFYLNGQLAASGSATFPLSVVRDANMWLGRSQWNDPYFNGSFEEFRIYRGPLSDDEIARDFVLGPDQVILPEGTTNTPPMLAEVVDQIVDELALFSLSLTATDADMPPQPIVFNLVNAPEGLAVDPTGALTWTPTEAQGPSTNSVRVAVSDGVTSVTNQFTVVVREVNTAPVLSSIPDKTIDELVLFNLTVSAADTDIPIQSLVFSLASGPAGMAVSPAGALTWTPTKVQGLRTNAVKVAVSDGIASVTNQFYIVVRAVVTELEPFRFDLLSINEAGQSELLFSGQTGITYVVEASTNLTIWTTITNIVPFNGLLRIADPDSTKLPSRFYRAVAPGP